MKNANSWLFGTLAEISDIQEALLYLSKTGIITIEGGFMVLYNKLQVERIADNRLKYKKEDYHNLNEFYRQRIQQIHIVGEYANLMVNNYDKAMEFVKDYFSMEFKSFIRKYFDSKRETEIGKSISSKKYEEIFGSLTPVQKAGFTHSYGGSQVREASDADFLKISGIRIQKQTFRPYRKRCKICGNQDIPFILL